MRIKWNDDLDRSYFAGVDRGMFYIPGEAGLPWNGIQEIVESSPDAILSQTFQDGQRMLVRRRDLNYEARLKAYTYPREFEPYAGYGGYAKTFGFSFRVMTGPDTYHTHLVYNVVAIPDDVVFSTLSDEIDPTVFSWKLSSRPVRILGRAQSSHIILDSKTVYPWTLQAIEEQMYGGEGVIPNLPTPDQIFEIFEENALLKVVDNGNGTVTITGPDEAIQSLTNNRVQVTWPSVIQLSQYEYEISSL